MADFDPTVDVRDMIAHGRHYNPRANVHAPVTFAEYPKYLKLKDGREFIAQNAAEEKKILGIVDEPAKPVSVEISNLAKVESIPVTKRKYTKRAVPAPLPANLD